MRKRHMVLGASGPIAAYKAVEAATKLVGEASFRDIPDLSYRYVYAPK